jgi:hypothetical protein
MKTEAMAVLVLARQKAKASNVKPVWVTLPKPTRPSRRMGPSLVQTMGGRSGSGSRPSVCC